MQRTGAKAQIDAGNRRIGGIFEKLPCRIPCHRESRIEPDPASTGSARPYYADPNRAMIARPMIQSLSFSERNASSSVKCAMRCRYVALANEFVMSVPQ